MVPLAPHRDLRRGRRGLRRPTGRGGSAAHLPPKDLAGPATLAARLRATSRAAARLRAMVTGHAGRRVRRTRARGEQARLPAGPAPAGTPRVPLPMTMFGVAARGPRPVASSAARAGPRPRVSSAAVIGPPPAARPGRPTGTPRAAPDGAPRGHRRTVLPVTGPGPRGRTGPGRRARGTASVTAAGRRVVTSGVMRAVRLRAMVPAVRTATTVPQRATGRVASVAAMAPRLTAPSVLTTAARPVTGGPPVTGVRDRILALTGPPVTGIRERILPQIGLSVTGRRDRVLPLTDLPAGAARMARRPGPPAGGPGTARRGATPPVTAPRRRPVGAAGTAGRNACLPGVSGPDRGTEAAPGAR
jgi:hypothetical protein